MPTPFDPTPNWDGDARSAEPRSIFGNFRTKKTLQANLQRDSENNDCASPRLTGLDLHAAINGAVARSFLYQFLAKAAEYPNPDGWAWLCRSDVKLAVRSAIEVIQKSESGNSKSSPEIAAKAFLDLLTSGQFESFTADYVAAFSHAARGSCPVNEIEYGDLKADPLFQPHRLADLAAFYRAFGLEMTEDATERQDHICVELEFMSVLTAKEAYSLEHQAEAEEISICRQTQKEFLREHLGRWSPAFARRLSRVAGSGALAALADFTCEFIVADCWRLNVPAGSEDLLLRPLDESGESLCANCGITALPPGATSTSGEI